MFVRRININIAGDPLPFDEISRIETVTCGKLSRRHGMSTCTFDIILLTGVASKLVYLGFSQMHGCDAWPRKYQYYVPIKK